MPSKLVHALVVSTLICAVGGHWAILQSVAWMGMAIRYAQDAPLSDALVKTFDGQHPCKLCQAVKEGRQAEDKQAVSKVETKLDFWLERAPSLVTARPPSVVLPTDTDPALSRAEAPPTPPPRAA
jgi:hypothetical protein